MYDFSSSCLESPYVSGGVMDEYGYIINYGYSSPGFGSLLFSTDKYYGELDDLQFLLVAALLTGDVDCLF